MYLLKTPHIVKTSKKTKEKHDTVDPRIYEFQLYTCKNTRIIRTADSSISN